MAFDVSGLAAYVKQDAKKIIAKQLLAAQTAEIIAKGGTVLTEVKSSEKIGNLETDAVIQDGAGCGFNASGATTFSDREITADKMKVEESLCLADLEGKYTQALLSAGVNYDDPADFDFNQYWIDRKLAKTGIAIEKLIWQGDKASGDATLNRINGYIKLLSGAAGVIQANDAAFVEGGVALATVTKANILKVLDALYNATPEEILSAPDLTFFIGSHWFRLAKLALRDANLYHFVPGSDPNVIIVPGTDLKLQRVNGLNGKNNIFGMRLSNMIAATDLLNDFTEVKVWQDPNTGLVNYSNKFKYGVNVGFASEVVEFKL